MLKFFEDDDPHFIADIFLTPLETLTKGPSSEASLLKKDEKGQLCLETLTKVPTSEAYLLKKAEKKPDADLKPCRALRPMC
jgi:hypothetical protein